MNMIMRSHKLDRIMQVDEPVIDENYNVRVPTQVKVGSIRDTPRIIS